MPLCALCLCAVISLIGAVGAELQISPVFVAGQDGYHTYRIPALILTTNSCVLAFCEGRKDSRSDSGKIDLLLKRSTNGGATWSARQIVWSDGDNTCGNPAPVVDQTTGILWLLMTWNKGADKEAEIMLNKSRDTRRVYVTHSQDNGLTWAAPRDITLQVKPTNWTWYATGPVNGIQLIRGSHKGRLVIPANHSELSSQTQSVSRSHIIFSDDHGATWAIGGCEAEKTDESTVVELSDGSLLHNMRSYLGRNRRAVARSRDAGITWSPTELDDTLIEPVCQASVLRCTWPEGSQPGRILFSNPASTKRENLTVRLSNDEGATWPISRTIHAGPAAYSCLAVMPDHQIGCLFECGQRSPYESISLARFSLDWLEKK